MNFNKAVEKMKQGYKVKRPNWSGYWNMEDGVIMMHFNYLGRRKYPTMQHKPLQDTDDWGLTIYQMQQEDWEVVDGGAEVDWEAMYHDLYNELLDYRRALNEVMEKVSARLENREEETIDTPHIQISDNISFETAFDVPDICKNCSNYRPGEINICSCTLPFMTWTSQ